MITDYNEVIRLNPDEKYAYYNRALALTERKQYKQAIDDYEHFVRLVGDTSGFTRQVALSKIIELEKRLENIWYDEIENTVDNIRKLLIFKNSCLTHYTSLSGARAMILENSSFRLSEGSFLNDTSEGRELFKYLSFDAIKHNVDETIEEQFIEKPFIGSFVADTKHNDLTLWRMYGKEEQAEAKGCALTIYKTAFINKLKDKLGLIGKKPDFQSESAEQFTFYNVAYQSKGKFIVSGSNRSTINRLNLLMKDLKVKIAKLTEVQKVGVTKVLNDIAYLFKSGEYQYENEVRLVVQGVGFDKTIENKANSPKVYIDLVDIVPTLAKITFGPKVERADEWAAAFNYYIKKQLKDNKEKVEIVISHLPFK